jgi:hypothetical protein
MPSGTGALAMEAKNAGPIFVGLLIGPRERGLLRTPLAFREARFCTGKGFTACAQEVACVRAHHMK